uniref:Putative secreted peptide n=1 Tax=Anopheles braziliensis TaxID=58242 RepID=A0A2M3ZPR1_9DIPT
MRSARLSFASLTGHTIHCRTVSVSSCYAAPTCHTPHSYPSHHHPPRPPPQLRKERAASSLHSSNVFSVVHRNYLALDSADAAPQTVHLLPVSRNPRSRASGRSV